ncbi:hypothetical protein MLD38_034956 [Melastoma candidum]|uniref:Uncharacterized protein n=1 Tax=Melastoma candidum TaxID=119954 RepID=A0ACB9MC50_9MYRT|nr:hypothetical protein MLD38_034956 [Melastoma candidum]
MEGPNGMPDGESANNSLQLVRYSPYRPYTQLSLAWFDLRVFYVRISNFQASDSIPESLTLCHVPLDPETLLEVNGVRCNTYSKGISCILRRDRICKQSEEVTFVGTDSIRLTGSVQFEVSDGDNPILSGFLEMSSSNGYTSESKGVSKKWVMKCESEMTMGAAFFKVENAVKPDLLPPSIEVYVAGCFAGNPIILTKNAQISFRKKHNRKCMLDAIPENEPGESQKDKYQEDESQVLEDRNYKPEYEEEYRNMYWRRNGELMDQEDGELSWFNAGVRVGVGIGLGICVGVGIGVGLLVRSYQTTTRNFRRRLF